MSWPHPVPLPLLTETQRLRPYVRVMNEATTFNVLLRKRSCVHTNKLRCGWKVVVPDINLLVNRAREAFLKNHTLKGKKLENNAQWKNLEENMIVAKNNRIFLAERYLRPPPGGNVHTTSAFCIGPNPRRIHSWGETRSPLSSGEEAKTQSFTSEKAQTAGLGA